MAIRGSAQPYRYCQGRLLQCRDPVCHDSLPAAPAGYPRSVFFIDMLLTVVVAGGARFAVRVYTETVRQDTKQRRTLLVGANREGTSIARQLREQPELNYSPVGFVDDDDQQNRCQNSWRSSTGDNRSSRLAR